MKAVTVGLGRSGRKDVSFSATLISGFTIIYSNNYIVGHQREPHSIKEDFATQEIQ